MFIEKFAEGVCDECGQARKGVELLHHGGRAFLCWEHFRLTMPALRDPQPAVIRETVFRCDSLSRCCCHCGCSSRYRSCTYGCSSGESIGYSSTSRGRSSSHSKGLSDGRSWSSSESRGESEGEARGLSEDRTQSES